MAPAALERVPRWIILMSLAVMAAAMASLWRAARQPELIGALWFLFSVLDLIMLDQLPRRLRSFGPVHPTLLALGGIRWALAAASALTRQPACFVVTMAAMSALIWYSTWVEPHRLQVSRRRIVLQDWPAGARPVRLLHLTDLHLERVGVRELRLQILINELDPDLICFSGDLLNLSYNTDDRSIQDARSVIGQWSARYGVFAVSGSPLVDLPEATGAILSGLPNIRWLDDECVSLHLGGVTLNVIGVTCSHNPSHDSARLQPVLAGATSAAPTVLVYHSPDMAPEAAAAGIDLMLSGHTHGGQLRLPIFGALVTSSIYGKRFETGEYHLRHANDRGETILYVSRGIGMEGGIAPRARFLCPPEIVLWTLEGGGDRS